MCLRAQQLFIKSSVNNEKICFSVVRINNWNHWLLILFMCKHLINLFVSAAFYQINCWISWVINMEPNRTNRTNSTNRTSPGELTLQDFICPSGLWLVLMLQGRVCASVFSVPRNSSCCCLFLVSCCQTAEDEFLLVFRCICVFFVSPPGHRSVSSSGCKLENRRFKVSVFYCFLFKTV